MNIASNPWNFVSGDVASSTAAASPTGMVQQGVPALGTVLYTSTAAHNLVAGQYVSYISDTNGRFGGFYKVLAVPSATTAWLANASSPTSGSPFATVIAASGGGTMLVNQVQQDVRIEDLSLQALAAGPTAGQLVILDRNGLPIWEANITVGGGTTGPNPPAQNRGKLFWVKGITLQTIPANIMVLATIN